MPAFSMLALIVANCSGELSKPSLFGVNSCGMTLPPAKPSSTTSTKRTFGVKIERTRASSTLSMFFASWVMFSIVRKNGRLNMSPFLSITAISTRLAPPNSCS